MVVEFIIGVLGFLATFLCLLLAMCCSMREESMIEKLHRIVKEKNSLKVIEKKKLQKNWSIR